MILRPSASHQWGPGRCPGSALMQEQYPELEESTSAAEGTAAHWYLTETLQGRLVSAGMIAPNGIVIDDEMVENAQDLIADVLILQATYPKAKLYVEQFVTAHGLIHPFVEGTLDIALVDFDSHSLFVWDYKYGFRPVSEYRNPQIITYAAGLIEKLEMTLKEFKGWSVRLSIAQPRYYEGDPLRHWSLLGHVLWKEIELMAEAAALAAAPEPVTCVGRHCRDCTARHSCPLMAEASAAVLDIVGQASPQPVTIDQKARDQKARELTLLRDAEAILKARITGLEALLVNEVRQSRPVAGYGLEQKFSRVNWTYPIEDVIALGDMMGVDLRKPQAPVTPNQARKAGLDDAVISLYSGRTPKEVTLVPVDSNKVERAFS